MVKPSRKSLTVAQWRYIHSQPKVCAVCVRKGLVHKYPRYDVMEIDHIIPVIQGGTNDKRNLQWCCKWHNNNEASKRAASITERELIYFYVTRRAVNG
jgi:hypothetical protein